MFKYQVDEWTSVIMSRLQLGEYDNPVNRDRLNETVVDVLSTVNSGRVFHDVNQTADSTGRDQVDMFQPPVHLLAICTILYVAIFILGLVGNVAVILVVLQYRSMRTSINLLFLNLCLADLFALIITGPTVVVDIFAKEVWYLGPFMCRLVTLLENVVGNASVVTILAISIERHRVAYNSTPATASYCSVIKSFLAIWLTSLAGALPILFIAQFQISHFSDGTPVHRCTTDIYKTWHKVYTVIGNLLFYIMPLFVILLLYTKVYMKLMMLFRREREKFKYPREIVHMKRQMRQIIITVVLVFFISHTPYRTIAMWTMFSPDQEAYTMDAESFLTMIYMTKLLLYSNHAINPFVYNFVSRKFRRALAWICCVKRQRNSRGDDTAVNPKHLLRNDSLRQPRHSPPADRCYDLDYFLRDKGREEQEVMDRHSQRNDFMVLYEHLLLK